MVFLPQKVQKWHFLAPFWVFLTFCHFLTVQNVNRKKFLAEKLTAKERGGIMAGGGAYEQAKAIGL